MRYKNNYVLQKMRKNSKYSIMKIIGNRLEYTRCLEYGEVRKGEGDEF